MTAIETSAGATGGETVVPAEHHWFDEAMRLPGATLDNVSDGAIDYDGPRCVADDCRTPVDNDDDYCPEPEPHPHACPTCGGTGITDDGDRLCPECTGRGQR